MLQQGSISARGHHLLRQLTDCGWWNRFAFPPGSSGVHCIINMHVIVLKYVQVLCITIFFSNNINCDKLLLHNEQEDQELYRIGACTAACMAGTEPGGPVDRNGTTVPSAEELKVRVQRAETVL